MDGILLEIKMNKEKEYTRSKRLLLAHVSSQLRWMANSVDISAWKINWDTESNFILYETQQKVSKALDEVDTTKVIYKIK